MRIAKPKGNLPTDIAIEYLMLSHLEGMGITPQPHWIDSTGFMYPLLIEDFVDGKAPSAKPDVIELKAVARTVATIHQRELPTSIPLADRSYQPRFAVLKERLTKALTSPTISGVAERSGFLPLMPRIKKFFAYATSFADNRPRVLLHGDLYPGNLLITKKGKRAVLIDFQSPAIGDPTFDFGNIFVDVSWREYYTQFKDVFLAEYLRHHAYPKLASLFDLRMVERDITSIISEFRNGSTMPPHHRTAIQKYFDYRRPQWRTQLIEQALDQLGV